MEATLFYLVFDITAVLLTEIPQHLAENPLQGIILHLTARLFLRLNLLVSVVADIEGSTIEMARILGSVTVSGSQFRYIILGTQDTGNDDLMQRNALDLQRIKIRPADILQQYRSPRHQIRNTVVQLIHIKERIAAHIHQFTLAMLSLLTVLNRSHAMPAGSHNLYILLIREGISEVRHRENAMLHFLAILIEKYRKSAIRGCIRSYRQFILLQIRSFRRRSITGNDIMNTS